MCKQPYMTMNHDKHSIAFFQNIDNQVFNTVCDLNFVYSVTQFVKHFIYPFKINAQTRSKHVIEDSLNRG